MKEISNIKCIILFSKVVIFRTHNFKSFCDNRSTDSSLSFSDSQPDGTLVKGFGKLGVLMGMKTKQAECTELNSRSRTFQK